jgi:hypothetical protein
MFEGLLTNMHTPRQITNLLVPAPAHFPPRPSPPLHPFTSSARPPHSHRRPTKAHRTHLYAFAHAFFMLVLLNDPERFFSLPWRRQHDKLDMRMGWGKGKG